MVSFAKPRKRVYVNDSGKANRHDGRRRVKRILTVNSGSPRVKFSLYDVDRAEKIDFNGAVD